MIITVVVGEMSVEVGSVPVVVVDVFPDVVDGFAVHCVVYLVEGVAVGDCACAVLRSVFGSVGKVCGFSFQSIRDLL